MGEKKDSRTESQNDIRVNCPKVAAAFSPLAVVAKHLIDEVTRVDVGLVMRALLIEPMEEQENSAST